MATSTLDKDAETVYHVSHSQLASNYIAEANTLDQNDAELAQTHEGEFGMKRDLKPRVVSMIAIAGTLGTGLFLGTGSSLINGGPVGMWLGYTFMGLLVGSMMMCLGEMMCFAPNVGGFIAMGTQYIDPAAGFMLGISCVIGTGLTVASEPTAIGILATFWDKNTSHVYIYLIATLALMIIMNIVGVKYFGEIEFAFAILKIALIIGLIIFGLIADLGGIPPKHEYIGGRYWRDEPFNDSFLDLTPVSKARFIGFWSVFTSAAFSYAGIETLAILAGEAYNPRKTMLVAVRTVFYRIVGIYVLSTLIIGLVISQHSEDLTNGVNDGDGTAAASPFVIVCKQMGVKALPSIVNAVVITSALSAGNENFYGCSRALMSLARQGSLPKFFLRTTENGIPYFGVLVATAFGLLCFLSVSNGSNQAFTWLSNLTALNGLITWITICAAYVRFYHAMKAQGIDRKKLPFVGWFQPYLAYVCIFFFTTILIFSGFSVFIGGFDSVNFVASYITIPFMTLVYVGYKFWRRTKYIPLDEVDLSIGPAEALRGTRYDLLSHGQTFVHAEEDEKKY
ncbi:hypothetical protein I350_07787 [Cryptococcus amylolentus CBS 6273]|nr:hypothetical protein I350_07787 [Cryptococcus amylolentus CBS 6273]